MLSSLPPARRRVVLTGAAVLVAVLVVTAVFVVGRLRGPSVKPVAQSTLGPVLLVPGYGGSVGSLTALLASLRAGGRTAEIVTLPDSGLGDLTVQAKALSVAAKAAMATTQAPSVDVVGYSAGGVVARLWVRDEGGGSLARRVVTLGSPQHGTELAGLGQLVQGQCPTACQQLSPTSPVLSGLNSGDETPAGPQFVSIWTTHDDVVLPPESARLEGALNLTVQSVCAADPVRHSGLPADPLVIAMVQAQLTSGATRSFGAGDCARLSG